MNKSLISTIIIWLFVLAVIWFAGSEYKKLSNAKQNSIVLEGLIDNVGCEKLHKSNKIRAILYSENGESFEFFPAKIDNLSLQEHCNKILNYYKNSQKFQATVLSYSKGSTPLDLYIDSEHIIQFDEEIRSKKQSMKNGIIGALLIGVFMTLLNYFIWYYKINMNRIIESKIFRWILYTNAILAILAFIFS